MEAYRHIKKIGEGAFGKALLVEDRKKKTKFVIKEVDMSKMRSKEKEEARKECAVLKEMRHPNIISFIKSFERGSKLHIVMDYADGGDLATKLSARRGRLLPEEQAVDWFVQICLALKHVHDRKILHRDLKTQNIFLTSKNIVKLGDFGIAKVLKNTRELARTQIGTPYYFSPELCDGKPYNNKSDVWSLGVVLYELCTLKYPFDGRSMQQLIMRIRLGTYKPISSTYSRELRTLLGTMLASSQIKRPSINGILKKPFVKGRIAQFLDETLLQEEFSHTVIHGNKKRQPLGVNNRRPSAHIKLKKEAVKKVAAKPEAAKPVVQTRGQCGVCDTPVRTDQDRTQDDDGKYFHIPCLRKERQRKRVEEAKEVDKDEAVQEVGAKKEKQAAAEKVKLAHEDALDNAHLAREKDAEDKAKYNQMLQDRHKEFLARRKQGVENRRRHQDRRQSASARGPAPVPHAKAEKPRFDGKNAKDSEHDAAVQEYNARQRQVREYKARAKQAMHGKNPLLPDAPFEEAKEVQKAPAAVRAGNDAAKEAAVQEYNERQRQVREYKARAKQAMHGKNPLLPDAPAAGARNEQKEQQHAVAARAGEDAAKAAAVQEYNERQRMMREYKSRAKEEKNGNAVAAAEPVAREIKQSAPSASNEKNDADAAAATKAAAVQEYNQRQRQMREYKARALEERNGGDSSVPRTVETRDEAPRAPRAPRASVSKVKRVPKAAANEVPRAPKSSAVEKAAPRKKWGAPPAVQLKVDPSVNLGVTHVVAQNGISDATTVIEKNAKGLPVILPEAVKEDKASKQRAMLRDMMKKNRAVIKRRPSQVDDVDIRVAAKPARKAKASAEEADAVEPADDAAVPRAAEPEAIEEADEAAVEPDVVKDCVSKVLDEQMANILADSLDDREASTPEPAADADKEVVEAPGSKGRRESKWGPVSNDIKIEMNINIDESDESFHSATSEPLAVSRESSGIDDYEGMLMQLSLACSQKIDISSIAEGDACDDAEDDDNDSVFGDEDETETAEPESVFARMERLRAELEEEVGMDSFFDSFKVLRDLFSADDAVAEVPQAVREQVLEQLGEGKVDCYHRLVELVKAECGLFE